jgi:voltage-gated potassium channel
MEEDIEDYETSRSHGSRGELGSGTRDVAVLAATIFVAAVMPLEVVFGSPDAVWITAVSLFTALLFARDVATRFSRPIVVGGRPVTERAVIRRHYLRTWFVVDVLAAIPFDVIAVAPGIAGGSTAQVLRLLSLLRVLRVARIVALQREWRVRTSFNPALLRLASFGFSIVMISHWIACGWIALDGSEIGHPELHPYQQALYWTITTLTTVGYGDISPVGGRQVFYAMVVMGLGVAMYGYIIGNVASLLANIDVLRSQHLGRIETINHFLRDRHVPHELQTRVRDYYNYLWESRVGNQTEMLDDLPSSLHIEIALHLHRNVLRKVPLFERASDTFLRELVLHLAPQVCLPGETILRRGQIGQRIYFINKGAVEVLSPDDTTVIATLSDGAFFGEMALLSSQPRANTVLAVDYCTLYTLERDRFDQVLRDFPDFAAQVRRVADLRRKEAQPDP